MKTDVSTSIIIDTKKVKKKAIKANCKICVNNSKNGCRFGWERIKGKCTRFGTNDYRMSKEEVESIKEHNKKLIFDKKNIKNTTIEKLSKALEVELTFDQVYKCNKPTLLGNKKFAIRRTVGGDNPIIEVIYSNRTLKYRIMK
ncbi:MAG: hypothetical protein E7E64_04960 [Clostridium celatum]|uniref:hypothetical protein n=1 Tax=Clostridium tertium TaxID=1559 RepID=UPI0029024900|nr:hypothetical protein [Clostridium celatum]